MVNIENKEPTRRRAVASGKLSASPATIARIREGSLPKGNVLPLAEGAGIMAAKKTSDLLPLCHPLPLDTVGVSFEFGADFVIARCEAIATAKTGVEMEALQGAMSALLCIYDLTKGIDPALTIGEIHLEVKEGGKSGHWTHPNFSHKETAAQIAQPALAGLRSYVVTLSDRCSRGEAEDKSGPHLVSELEKAGAEILGREILPDDQMQIRETIGALIRKQSPELIFCTGGTGLSPRDVTIEAIAGLGGKLIAGFGEALRAEGMKKAPHALLSRSEAWLIENTIVIALPGSLKASREGFETLAPLLKHACEIARGSAH